MASPTSNTTAPLTADVAVQGGEALRSVLMGLRTFHKLASTANSAPTDAYGILDGTDTGGANVIVSAVPNGANYLVLFHDYRADNASLTTAPIVRVYGEVPEDASRNNAFSPPALAKGPDPFAGSEALLIPKRHWIPLGELSTGALAITIGSLTPSMVTTIAGNDWYRGGPSFVALLGVSRVIVTVSTAAVSAGTFTAGASAINGCFGF